MPAIDYVSIVRSLYADKGTMAQGAAAAAFACAAAAYKTGSVILWIIVGLFGLITLARWLDMSAFERTGLASDDAEQAEHWEMRSTVGASLIAALYGTWCLVSFALVNDPFAELAALSVTLATLASAAARNYGVDRLITLQAILFGVPLVLGLVLVGDIYHLILAILFVPYLLSLRRIAGTVRQFLLSALHGRIAATRLAGQFDTALETMQHGLIMLDADGKPAVVNGRARQILDTFGDIDWTGGRFADALVTASVAGLLPKRAVRSLVDGIEQGSGRKLVFAMGEDSHCEVTLTAEQGRTVLLFEDVTERISAQERISYMARFDELTGLPNRSYFKDQVGAELRDNGRGGTQQRLLMIVDLDDFKHVNDTLGHLAGDELLAAVSQRLRDTVGQDAFLSRFGGDEYTVFRRGRFDAGEADRLGAKVISAFAEPFSLSGRMHKVNVSVGAVIAEDGDEFDSLLTKADLALYRAKGEGKARVQVFADEMDIEYRYRQRLKEDLRKAVAGEQLYLVYQPIVARQSRRVEGCEALARWKHPELGNIPPMVFIPIAEEIGVISDITRWVLRAASSECKSWPDDLYVSVNVSASDFRHGDVRDMIEDALDESGLSADRLEIEVTENVFLEEKKAAVAVLTEIAAMGVGIALDDFGTGYSSLSYLHDLPFSKLKIDRTFVVDVANSERSLKLLTNIARLSKDLELKVTVEGVETEEQLALIAENAPIDHIQGYLFGAPLPRDEVLELIRRLSGKDGRVFAMREAS